ncbi:tyrosine-type recombinase/integrase [Variovorax sp. RB2P76]|uniref:tyrosine-type recombinase/integrase n=1 Tax=Variovorax sp. RB2P76 TaxID=3443736 RepID=UPI003F483FD7
MTFSPKRNLFLLRFMLIRTDALPDYVIVDPVRLLPRFWSTAWSLNLQARAYSENTRKLRLRHLDAFYLFCDQRFGLDSLDEAISERNAIRTQDMVEAFYLDLTSDPQYNTNAVQRWNSVRGFVQVLARRFATSSSDWSALSSAFFAMGKIRTPMRGRVRFIRALPSSTLIDLLSIANPGSPRNPFKGEPIRWRNWLIFNLLLLAGLRRGEAMLLRCDSLKRDIDPDTGKWVNWLDVTTSFEKDPRSSRPSMKTAHSHRQIPISHDLADLFERYASEFRRGDIGSSYLLTARSGTPLSAESITKIFLNLSNQLEPEARKRFFDRSGGKEFVSAHDLRHTCATARYAIFMAQHADRELAMQRMRAFFGWSETSNMPDLYARAAIQEDLLRSWSDLFEERTDLLRKLKS